MDWIENVIAKNPLVVDYFIRQTEHQPWIIDASVFACGYLCDLLTLHRYSVWIIRLNKQAINNSMQIQFGALVLFMQNSKRHEKTIERISWVCMKIICKCRHWVWKGLLLSYIDVLNSNIHIKYGAHLTLFRFTAFDIRYRIIAQNNNPN